MTNKWTVIYHTADPERYPHIHKDRLLKSNPKANILLADCSKYKLPAVFSQYRHLTPRIINKEFPESSGFSPTKIRNCIRNNHDKFIRDWARDNLPKITTNNVALIEWDVLVNKPFPNLKMEGASSKFFKADHRWCWMAQEHRLQEFKDSAFGLTPFAVLLFNKECIKEWVKEKYDSLYERDIFCELRIGTIMNYSNNLQGQIKLPNIRLPGEKIKFSKETLLTEDFFHPVKTNELNFP